MGGIAGIFGSSPSREALDTMLERLAHRGLAVVEEGAAGDRSFLLATLSHDSQYNSDEAGPPAAVDTRRAAHMTFDGRLFNREELQQTLQPIAAPEQETDAELLLRLFEERGPDCLALLDGVYALAVTDPARGLVLARDPLGVRPMYTGSRQNQFWFASEIKAFGGFLDEYSEFPPGCWQQPGRDPVRFRQASPEPAEPVADLAEATAGVLDRLRAAITKRLRCGGPTGVYLSGGLDSSLIAALMAEQVPCFDTFAVGMEGSADIEHARICAQHLGTRHHEYIYDTKEMVDVLPEVIRSLESYDAPLVRSAVPNYFLARLAAGHVRIALSGEGADELFAGYRHMAGLSRDELRYEMLSALASLHRLALQRGDRMSMAHGIEAHAPFLDEDLVNYAFRLEPELNFGPDGAEKWILRIAGADLLPEAVTQRRKQKFSRGAGSADVLAEVAGGFISDAELERESRSHIWHRITGKEELMYYRLFRRCFPEAAAERTLGFTAAF